MAILLPDPPDDDAAVEVLDEDPPDDAALDAEALDDDDELDPHPAITTTTRMATTIAPAPKRARSDLNMVPLLLSKRPRCRFRVHLSPGSGKAKRFAQLAASPRR
jgi:hypothetical protein